MGLDTDFGEVLKRQPPPSECEDSKSATVELVKRLRGQIGSKNPELIQILLARRESGKEKYGTELLTFNGRDALVDAFQEQCDACVYLAQHVAEIETMIAQEEAQGRPPDNTPKFMAEERLDASIQLMVELWNDIRLRLDDPRDREEDAPSILLP